ncbi:hypothetical protein NDU88_002275 [Pleurodeles waltl]|uniref:Uncharacterized protein n=1 Tax=Pleurodeles waltl TaxID=8319 RepID=A0AAV7LDC6_PLEWA|nr:hypothetical protein NDU88_002275 [Pleurodeles waltl]
MKAYARAIITKFFFKQNSDKEDQDELLDWAVSQLQVTLAAAIRPGGSRQALRALQAQIINSRFRLLEILMEKVAASYVKIKTLQYEYGDQVGQVQAHQISYKKAGHMIEHIIGIDGVACTTSHTISEQFA